MTQGVPAELELRVARALGKNYSPSGDEKGTETWQTQVENEQELETVFHLLLETREKTDAEVIAVFFCLFDVLIGMYRLEKCEKYLRLMWEVIESPEVGDSTRIKAYQCKGFLLWKQNNLQEALNCFKKIEDLLGNDHPSPALCENIAHTLSSMGELGHAEEYFHKAISLNAENVGGILLGLGLLKDRQGDVKAGIDHATEALKWFQDRFSSQGKESSLEAKCALSLAKMHAKVIDGHVALAYANQAVELFSRTCGRLSPLTGSAFKVKGDILLQCMNRPHEAVEAWLLAYNIEARKDAIDLMTLIELQSILCEHIRKTDTTAFASMLETLRIAVTNARTRVSMDGNFGAFLKFAAHGSIYAGDFENARELLSEAVALLGTVKDMDCESVQNQCIELIKLIDQKAHA